MTVYVSAEVGVRTVLVINVNNMMSVVFISYVHMEKQNNTVLVMKKILQPDCDGLN